METTNGELDALARHLISAVRDDVRLAFGVQQVDIEVIGILYIRLRNALASRTTVDGALIEELALTVYLTICAWQPEGKVPVEILASIARNIAAALQSRNDFSITEIESDPQRERSHS